MAKTDARLTTDYWHKGGVSTSELLKVHKQLAKRTNQRLLRLERSASSVTGESFASYGAADKAKEYLTNQGRNRFRENISSTLKNIDEAQQRYEALKDIKAMQDFLTSKSSTVKGQKEIEQKRIETFEEQGIESASNKEFYDFLNSETFKELTKSFDSNTIVEAYDDAIKQGKTSAEIATAFDDYRNQQNISVKGLRDSLGLTQL